MKTKFYTQIQNNSGGYFVNNEKAGVGRIIVIEAKDAAQHWRVLEGISYSCPGFFDFCDCCGERWSDWMCDEDGTETPEVYGQPLQEYLNETGKRYLGDSNVAFVHYLDGRIEKVEAVNA